MKSKKEWNIKAPWGNIALVSWGDPKNPPALLVHGFMDSAATFALLVEEMPDTYYYVAFDIPGHGKSEPFPPGLIVSQITVVEVIRLIVEYMKWDKFINIAHSMGFNISVFYNHLYPGKITRMVHLDPGPPISMYYYSHYKVSEWYLFCYDSYYRGYKRWNAGSSKRLTIDEAVNLLVRSRSLSEEQAEVVLSRSLVPVGDGKYKLSWDTRMKKIATIPVSEEILYTIITQHAPPSLIIEAAENNSSPQGKKFSKNVLEKCNLMVPNFYTVTVQGGHDVHITNPEIVTPHIEKFLKSDIQVIQEWKSKL
ncbi:unnamed protein product [Chrysodeixis includens]|uniref:AB hydrolase-1 domain-containing protein n=1 Tax=Chrysodeixis includens TaxID=689277 RepID=A0A9P0BRI3_CHRIL|nr:unnamed protein product [Chrysodeixis includens]